MSDAFAVTELEPISISAERESLMRQHGRWAVIGDVIYCSGRWAILPRGEIRVQAESCPVWQCRRSTTCGHMQIRAFVARERGFES